ncbi:MAG: S41 family peptidase [Rhodobacteraceae bacterium]|nr:S41 family peptidase [Paracoccaceae bacterium]
MNRYLIAAFAGGLAGIVLTTQVAGPLIAQETERQRSTFEHLNLFGEIFDRIRAGYVDEVDERELIEAAISGMLSSLDPHSSYLPPEAYGAMRVQTRGEFGGLGIEVTMEDGVVKVVSPIDGTPAYEAGIQAGDYITHVDEESMIGLTLENAVERMRGPVGSEIVITVVREGVDEPFDVTIVRDTIQITAVRARLEGAVGILRITTFNDQTFRNLRDGIGDIISEAGGIENVDGFVVDLRNNPGGLLQQAIRVSDAFLERGEITSTRSRSSTGERFNASPGDLAQGRPLVVLINAGSASASEIVAGALQDHGRAVVVGTRSFGKGSVQTIMQLRGDDAIRLTTSRYYTPSGRSIQALGVTPDIIVEQRTVADNGAERRRPARSEADLRGRLENDTLTEQEREMLQREVEQRERISRLRDEDYQLAFALDLISGVAVFNNR